MLALSWLLISSAAFLLEKDLIVKEGAQSSVFLFIFSTTLCAALLPMLNYLRIIQKHFRWTDAMSTLQKNAIKISAKEYCRVALSDNYTRKLMPYVKSYAAIIVSLSLLESIFPYLSYVTIYLLGVSLVMCISALVPMVISRTHAS
jgi:hypothetical protein